MALRVVVIISLIAVGVPTSAQERRDLTRRADWSRVSRLSPGDRLLVQRAGQPAEVRYFVALDDASIKVLALTDAALTEPVKRRLRRLAPEMARHPRAAVEQHDVRLEQAGLFVQDQKILDYSDVVQLIPRSAVDVDLTLTCPREALSAGKQIGITAAILGTAFFIYMAVQLGRA